MRNFRYVGTVLAVLAATWAWGQGPAVYMANGIKVGEVDQTSAIVWTRLTQHPERNVDGHPFTQVGDPKKRGVGMTTTQLAAGHALKDMEGSAPGARGDIRVTWWLQDAPGTKQSTGWKSVDPKRDFIHQFPLTGLKPGAQYLLRAEGRPAGAVEPTCKVDGRFRTAPSASDAVPVEFVVVTCGEYPRRDEPERGHRIYNAMKKLGPDFFVHTGDIEYYDKPLPFAPNQELARFKWNRLFAMPYQRAFHNNVTSYFIKDDHDTLKNDCWPGQTYGDLTWEQGLAIFREQVPMGEKTYRTIRWGKDVQVWLVEGRDFRSPNTMPDGPGKSIWGAEQKAWFKRTVAASDATFKVLITPTPIVGPDRKSKRDNHSNACFATEGKELREFMAAQPNMITINGDRHWQYVSVDDETGLCEFGTGPSSDQHAGGWEAHDFRPEHQYLNLKGGFLHVTVTRENGKALMRLAHRGVDGDKYNEVTLWDETAN